MHRTIRSLATGLLTTLALTLGPPAEGAQSLPLQLWQWVVGGGGGVQSDPTAVSLRAILGQPLGGVQTAGAGASIQFGFWQEGFTVIGVDDDGPPLPARTRLRQNVPNPFNPSTTIRFDLATAGRAVIRIYDLRGRVVARVLDARLPAGRHRVAFEPRDLASGVYFYELRHAATREVKRLTLVK
jgi:hypothetical protein